MNIQEMRYKEVLPDKTVKRLKKILKENGIDVKEKWQKESSVGTYSLRLFIKDLDLGQNGKGMTKDFAAASAYAEFFERYQNGLFRYRVEKPTKELPFTFAPDEKEFSVENLVKENNSFLNNILKQNDKDHASEKEKIAFFKELFNENSKLVPTQDKHISVPYYSIKSGKLVHLPYMLFAYLCTSNGMCAGNSAEEAIIEGISEILERFVSMKVFRDKISFPEIPDSYIENFPTVRNMLLKLKSNTKYTCRLVDCSLGGKYPVAGLFVIEKNTGRFGFKLGAHPDYGIAMERCFTEAAQGIDIYDYARSCLFDFDDSQVAKNENIKDFLDKNVATVPYQIWQENPTYKFTQMPMVQNLTNKEILDALVKKLVDEGYDILLRDVSVFGFPSYSIVIPGMSEINNGPMAARFDMYITLSYLLKHLETITLSNVHELIHILETEINEVGIGCLSMFTIVKDINVYPYDTIGMGCKYLLSLCYIMNKEYCKASKVLEDLVFMGENLLQNELQKSLTRAIYYYSCAMEKFANHEKAMHYIKILFDANICNGINSIFIDREKILTTVYNLNKNDFVEYDDAYYLPFMKTLREKQKQNVIDQLNNRTIFNHKEKLIS